jgi:hypothetical protein
MHVFDADAADPVGEIMILRRCHRRRQMTETEFFQARQEALLLLAAKHPEHEFRGVCGAAPCHDRENEAGEIGMIEIGDAPPSQPLRRRCAFLRHVCSLVLLPPCEHTSYAAAFTRISWLTR